MERLSKSMEEVLNRIEDPGLRRAAASLGRSVLDKEPEPPATPKSQLSAPGREIIHTRKPLEEPEQYYLPLWMDDRRGVPNSILRGALFAAIQGKFRRPLKRELLETQKGIEIRFTGWQLSQTDLDVWEHILHMHMVQRKPLGVQTVLNTSEVLKSLNLTTGKSDYNWLKEIFSHLAGAVVEITYAPGMTYAGNLLNFWRDDNRRKYIVEVNPQLAGVYAAGWTAVNYEQRRKMRRKPLALWLHGYYSSHAKPYPVKTEYLYKLSGSTCKNMRDFKYRLKKALQNLIDVEAIRSFEVDGDMVTVEVIPNASQRKYLDAKKISPKATNSESPS